jgi:hypothetical protein
MKLILPLSVVLPRKTKEDKKIMLNLNTFRNLHHMSMNQAKIAWYKVVLEAIGYDEIEAWELNPPLIFTYTVFANDARKFDLGNILPAVQKFTDDALVEMGEIEDDNYHIIGAINYRFGGIDKGNGRVELQIDEWR